jgi:2-hydroxy-3-oxopropionate reductase
MSKIGFIGLGIMGRPMAGHLQAGGHELYLVKHHSPLPKEILEDGATECKSAKEIAERSEIIILMLPDTPDVEQVMFGEDGVAAGLNKGKTVIDMSSISPIATKDFAARINEFSCDYVDAPVSGGEVGAKNAALTIMVGATKAVFERVKPSYCSLPKRAWIRPRCARR